MDLLGAPTRSTCATRRKLNTNRGEHFPLTFEVCSKNRCDPYESGVRGQARINNKIIEMEIFVNGWKFATLERT